MTEQAALSPGQILVGPLSTNRCASNVQAHGVRKFGRGRRRNKLGALSQGHDYCQDLETLTVFDPRHTFDGDGRLLRLGIQAYSLGIAYEFDPYFGLSISRVDRCHTSSRRFTTTC